MLQPASRHIATCHSPTRDPDDRRFGRCVEIREDRDLHAEGQYVVSEIGRDRIAEYTTRRFSDGAAIRLAAEMGYTEVVYP